MRGCYRANAVVGAKTPGSIGEAEPGGVGVSEEAAFLRAVQSSPADATAKLVYADWLIAF